MTPRLRPGGSSSSRRRLRLVRRAIAHEDACDLEREIHPLVEIERERVHVSIPLSAGASSGTRRASAPKAIHVEPEFLFRTEVGECIQVIRCAAVAVVPVVPITQIGRWPASRSPRRSSRDSCIDANAKPASTGMRRSDALPMPNTSTACGAQRKNLRSMRMR